MRSFTNVFLPVWLLCTTDYITPVFLASEQIFVHLITWKFSAHRSWMCQQDWRFFLSSLYTPRAPLETYTIPLNRTSLIKHPDSEFIKRAHRHIHLYARHIVSFFDSANGAAESYDLMWTVSGFRIIRNVGLIAVYCLLERTTKPD